MSSSEEGQEPSEPPGYPEQWEADVVLRDGSTCHVRPIRPSDADALRRFHSHLSPETIYTRFFSPYPDLSDKDVVRLTCVDYDARMALVATVGGEIVGVGRYDQVGEVDAEVAFTVRDDYQGHGLGSVLLEHLAATARERGLRRFVADVLPQNRRMVGTFSRAGYRVAQELEDGVVKLAFDIEPTQELRSVMQAREHRAESRSVERLLSPTSIAVVGASGRAESLGGVMLRNLIAAGFEGPLYPIHPSAKEVAGLRAYPSVLKTPGRIDLAIVVVPEDRVSDVVDECAQAEVHALVIVSAGFSDAGPAGAEKERELSSRVREHGLRMVGPNSLGLINTDPRVKLRAALVHMAPPRGRVALACQSAALAVAALDRMALRRLGLSSFVSVGNRGDVSGDELLHFWMSDGVSSVVLMYVESMSSPAKFIRVVRNVSRQKPVVIVRAGRTSQAFPLGARPRRTELPAKAVDQLLADAGVVEASSLGQMIDIGGILACQPLAPGRRVAVVGDTHSLVLLAADTCVTVGLSVVAQTVLRGEDVAGLMADELRELVKGESTDAVLVVHVPPVFSPESGVRDALVEASNASAVPVLAVLHAEEGTNALLVAPGPDGSAGHGSVPCFGTVEEAVQALSLVVGYSEWRRRPRGEVPEHSDIDTERARELLEGILTGGIHSSDTVRVSDSQMRHLLACYGIGIWPWRPIGDEDSAVAEADELGWPALLKTTDPRFARSGDNRGVRTSLENERALRAAYLSLSASLDHTAMSQLVVQRMAPPGFHCAIRTQEDPLFGPTVSFGFGGALADLLADRGHVVPPITDADAARLVRQPAAASLLFGRGGTSAVDVPGLEDLVVRVGRMADELPQLAQLDLDPIIVSPGGPVVAGAVAWLRVPEPRSDGETRRLSDV
ncbi:MAG: GNAT family N-acetyltransferase [Candidatus Nanopelagicales bacterium]|nr:GNAT family N-acetyltransferase [Candidatus Nanopelagicales bacterium]